MNPRWRGRFPQNVINRRDRAHWSYLKPDDEALLCTFGECHGKRVRILRFATSEERERLKLEGRADCWFAVEAVDYKFPLDEIDNGVQAKQAIFASKELRRIPEVSHG